MHLLLFGFGEVRYIKGNSGARALLAPDGQEPSHHPGPFLHGRQPHALVRGLMAALSRVKTSAVILDDKRDAVVGLVNGYGQQASLGVLADIGETFLDKAVNGDLGLQVK